ncbi:MAG: TIGR03905 family TSCPD domain-containing protein [Lachnospiraceae bacterium]
MHYIYKTHGTCSTQIALDIEGDTVHNVVFTGGCNGNLQAIPKLVEGLTVSQIEEKIGGIHCNGRPTSCGDQLARACREAYNASLAQ